MDPIMALGAAAAITQFAGQIATIAFSLAKLYSRLKDAPVTIRKQLIHVEQLESIAKLIITNVALQTVAVAACLQTCMQVSYGIETELTKFMISSGDGRTETFAKKIMAVLKQSKFETMFRDLVRAKQSLMLCIQEIDS